MEGGEGHVVDTIAFEVEIPAEKDYPTLANMISRIGETQIPGILRDIFQEFGLGPYALRIPQMEIDIGEISLTNSPDQLLSRFSQALKKWLLEALKEEVGTGTRPMHTIPVEEREFLLLRYFLEQGNLPWWGRHTPPYLPDDAMRKAIRTETYRTRELIFDVGRAKTVRKRIVHQFKDETLYALFGILGPRPSSFFREYAADLSRIHQQQQVVEEEDRAFTKVLQELILTYLLAHKASSIDQTEFFRRQLEMLSRQYGIAYQKILERMMEAMQAMPQVFSRKSEIRQIVQRLLRGNLPAIIQSDQEPEEGMASYPERLAMLFSRKPEQLPGKYRLRRYRDALLRQMLRRNKMQTWKLLTKLHRKYPEAGIRLGYLFSEKILASLLHAGRAGEEKHADVVLRGLEKLQASQLLTTSQTPSLKALVYGQFLDIALADTANTGSLTARVLRQIARIQAIPLGSLVGILLREAEKKTMEDVELLSPAEGMTLISRRLGRQAAVWMAWLKYLQDHYPDLKGYLASTAFYQIVLDLIQLYPSDRNRPEIHLLRLMKHLAHRTGMNIQAFFRPLWHARTETTGNLTQILEKIRRELPSGPIEIVERSLQDILVREVHASSKDYPIPASLLRSLPAHTLLTDKQDLPSLQRLASAYLQRQYPLWEEFLRQLVSAYPPLESWLGTRDFMLNSLRQLSGQPATPEGFSRFLAAVLEPLHQRLGMPEEAFQQKFREQAARFSPSLRQALAPRFPREAEKKTMEDVELLSPAEGMTLISRRLGRQAAVWMAWLKYLQDHYPDLKGYLASTAFYQIVLDLIQLYPSDRNRPEIHLLRLMKHLAHRTGMNIQAFFRPLWHARTATTGNLTQILEKIRRELPSGPIEIRGYQGQIQRSEALWQKWLSLLGLTDDSDQEEAAGTPPDPASLFLEAIWMQELPLLQRLQEYRFHEELPVLLAGSLDAEGLQFLERQLAGTNYPSFAGAKEAISNWLRRQPLAKLPGNTRESWLRLQSLQYLLQFGMKPFQTEDFFAFLLDRLHAGRLLPLRALDKTLSGLPNSLQQEILLFASGQDRIPTPKKVRDLQFHADVVWHFLRTGKIQSWLANPYLERADIVHWLREAIRTPRMGLLKSLLAQTWTTQMVDRLWQLMDTASRAMLISLIPRLYPRALSGDLLGKIRETFPRIADAPDIEEQVFKQYFLNRLWAIGLNTLQQEVIGQALAGHYGLKWNTVNLVGIPYTMDWLAWFLETGTWPDGFEAIDRTDYFLFVRTQLRERPEVWLEIAENIRFASFHRLLWSEIYPRRELGLLLKRIIQLKHLNSDLLNGLLDRYLLDTGSPLAGAPFQFLMEALVRIVLFDLPSGKAIDPLLRQDLSGRIPELPAPTPAANRPESMTIGLEKEMGLLAYYLTYGSVPADEPAIPSDAWDDLLERLLLQSPRVLLLRLHGWSGSLYRLHRLTTLFSERLLIRLLALVDDRLWERWKLLGKTIQAAVGESWQDRLGIKHTTGEVTFLLALWSRMPRLQPGAEPLLYQALTAFSEKRRMPAPVLLALLQEKASTMGQDQARLIEDLRRYSRDTTKEKVKQKESLPSGEGYPENGIPVGNAGLVLLWPFLGRLFRRLNLVTGKEFLDEVSRMRAIQLTQYLVTGQTEMPGYDLTLNRLLCGAGQDFEVDFQAALTQEELNLCDSLLAGALANWEKLKGTRIDTFRETFLQRNGTLYFLENRWELQVEKKAYDLLLDTLPWGIQMIQMSWMTERLVVLWR